MSTQLVPRSGGRDFDAAAAEVADDPVAAHAKATKTARGMLRRMRVRLGSAA